MKNRTKVWLTILMVVILLLGWIVYKQWNTITAFTDSLKYSQDELEQSMAQNKEELQKFLDEEENITVRDLTQEEAEALSEGSLSEEEVVALLTGKASEQPEEEPPTEVAPKDPVTEPVDDKAPPAPVQTPDPSEQAVSEAIARLYIQKSTYLNKLDAIEAEARAEFISKYGALDAEGEKAGKKEMLTTYLPRVSAWESECDKIVYGILDEIRAELKKSGKDESIVDKMKTAYLDEKRTKKAYFINRYMD